MRNIEPGNNQGKLLVKKQPNNLPIKNIHGQPTE
jgi:hypothetical protein